MNEEMDSLINGWMRERINEQKDTFNPGRELTLRQDTVSKQSKQRNN